NWRRSKRFPRSKEGKVISPSGSQDIDFLFQADLGIAMNMSGSDVSKEAANMILLGK
ncbi:1875_t:CDS:1, partial [Acaulospora colombiana]